MQLISALHMRDTVRGQGISEYIDHAGHTVSTNTGAYEPGRVRGPEPWHMDVPIQSIDEAGPVLPLNLSLWVARNAWAASYRLTSRLPLMRSYGQHTGAYRAS